jgi:UPF0755 protein
MKIILFFLLFFLHHLHPAIVKIPEGSTAKWISNHLKQNELINSANLFYIHLRANNLTTKLHSGIFNIPKGSSYSDISNILTGKTPQLISVTIPEGFTLNEIASRLEKNGVIGSATDFLNSLNNFPTVNDLLSDRQLQSFEGIFFPDTYYFSRQSPHHHVIQTFVNRFNQVLLNEYRKIKHPRLSFYDTLILASIIEKEAGTVQEMPIISGVFHNRLQKKMHLASCPTVGYAMGEPRKKFLTYKDLKYSSPFNTYKHLGLPPTPIASPGKRAFLAALFPAKTPYLYFVSKNDNSGTHVFSMTLDEHLRNQKKILSGQL